MAEQIKVPGVLKPGTGTYHSYAKDIIDDQLRNKKQSELNTLFNQGKGLDANGNVVPVVGPTNADNISYTDNIPASQHPSGSTGRKIKQLEDRIDSLVPAEEPTLGESVDLADYMMSDNVASSFTYDVSKKYVYGDKVTSMCTYARNNTSYAAFKVVDVDLYIVYTISGNTFTYYAQMDSETLPNEARSKFELGRYALVKQLQGATGDSWVDGTAGVFVGTDERPMAFKYVPSVEINSQTVNNVLLARTSNDSHIYVYRLQSGLFKYYTKVASSNAAFEALNNLIVGASRGGITGATVGGNPVTNSSGILQFDAYPTVPIKSIQVDGASSPLSPDNDGKVTIPAQPRVPITGINDANNNPLTITNGIVTLPIISTNASDISFDDSVLHTGYDNVQDVLQVMCANIQGYVTELKINLRYPNSNPITNKQVNITVYWHGDVYDLSSQYTSGFSGFKTDSNGNITITIPYSSTYNLSFIALNDDYLTPEPISGTSDLNSITHNVTYTAISNNENVIPTVYIANGSPSVSLDNKILYIDTIDSSDNVLISHYRKGVLNSVGRLKAVYDENNTLLSSPVIEIAREVKYRIYLDLWDSTIPADSQSYVASPLQIYTASKARRLINLWYTNVSVGIFLAIKNNNSEKGYDSYRMFEVDDPTENSSIGVTINNIDYEVYKNGNDIYRKQVGSSTGEPWIEYANINTILGVGIKTIELESEQCQDSIIDSLGYSSLSIMLLRSVPYSNVAIQQYSTPAFPFYNFKDGMYVTRLWYNYEEGNTSPAAQYAIDDCTIQLVTENGTINIPAFIPSQLQIKPIVANYAFLVNVFDTINGTLPTVLTNGSTLISSSMSGNSGGYIPGRYISWTKTNINSSYSAANTAINIIFVYPFR